MISQSACVTQFSPTQITGQIQTQIPRQIILRQVITGQNLDEQQDFFLIDERRTAVGGPGRGTGSFLKQTFPIPLLILVAPMVAMAMVAMMSTANSGTTSRTPTNVQATVPDIVPTTQTAVLPIPCVPTNCPEGYMLLDDETASPDCYFHSEQNTRETWANALSACTMTPGASLWRPNTEAEALAVFDKFQCVSIIWTGANSHGQDGNYIFTTDNTALDYPNVPFGRMVFISQNTCVTQFLPGQILGQISGQIPRQILPRQVITRQDIEEEQQELFLIDEGGTASLPVDGTRQGTGSFLQLLPIPLLTMAVPMVAMAMMTMMSPVNAGTTSGTSVATTIVPVTVPTTQAAALTTQCVPTINCPKGYELLGDQTASANCYFNSVQNGVETKTWANAQASCAMTPGAYLWRPNSAAEGSAVFDMFTLATNANIWTGANSPGHDDNYVFVVDNGVFSYANVPFGDKFIVLDKRYPTVIQQHDHKRHVNVSIILLSTVEVSHRPEVREIRMKFVYDVTFITLES
ncbi:Hypothetical predicted protein [Mytilus galloprovincialis]|uniref:C-type lectin domain-containing protein n=1 Tax=Mytilus galloprovincialis TaxID=29158 RepID=A0A8B6CRU7_MYTGA|nr:Hypothetical predicted protein [Mytilus galloprovincialis]